MEKRIIARGLLAGALGGVLAFVFARIFVEPVIGRAIDFEDGRSEAAAAMGAHEHGMEVFTRDVQANVGMGFGVLAFSVAMGALFAVAFVVAYGRVGTLGPRALSLLMAQFLREVTEGVPAETRSADNIHSLAMVLGAIESAKRGQRVPVVA